MATTKPPTAFIAAGVVLLVMPLLIAIGIGVLGLAAGLPSSDPRATRVMLFGSLVWIALVAVIVTVFVVKLLRRSRRESDS